MANAIQTIEKYIPLLDEVLCAEMKTAVLETAGGLVQETASAGKFLIAKTNMDGLGNYSREEGFVKGAISLNWEEFTCQYDRGRSFHIDAMDDLETLGLAFGTLAGEFLRTKVVPETDAIRFATYSQKAGHKVEGALTKENIDESIIDGEVAIEDSEGSLVGAYLFINPVNYGLVKKSDNFTRVLVPSENPNRNYGSYDDMTIVKVPKSRFVTKVTLKDGKSSDQATGGFVMAEDGKEINFMIINPSAVLQITKHAKLRVFAPDVNQSADAYKIDYRLYHGCDVYENKNNLIYANIKA